VGEVWWWASQDRQFESTQTNENADVLDALCYFFVPLLEKWRGQPVTANFLARGAKIIYGWNLTEAVGQSFLERLRALVLVTPAENGARVLLSTPADADASAAPAPEASSFLEEVVAKFEAFPLIREDLINRHLTTEQLSEILVRFLVSLDAYSSDGIARELRTRLQRLQRVAGSQVFSEELSIFTQEQTYLCARFIRELSSTDPDLTSKLSSIAGAGLLAELVEDFRKPTSITASSETTIILDAPFALSLLGAFGAAPE
jgi:hypothetical protein